MRKLTRRALLGLMAGAIASCTAHQPDWCRSSPRMIVAEFRAQGHTVQPTIARSLSRQTVAKAALPAAAEKPGYYPVVMPLAPGDYAAELLDHRRNVLCRYDVAALHANNPAEIKSPRGYAVLGWDPRAHYLRFLKNEVPAGERLLSEYLDTHAPVRLFK